MNGLPAVLACVAMSAAFAANADAVYKCTDQNGRIEFRDWPCTGETGGEVTIHPNVVREIDQTAAAEAGKVISERLAERAKADEADRAARITAQAAAAPPDAYVAPQPYVYPYAYVSQPRSHRRHVAAPVTSPAGTVPQKNRRER